MLASCTQNQTDCSQERLLLFVMVALLKSKTCATSLLQCIKQRGFDLRHCKLGFNDIRISRLSVEAFRCRQGVRNVQCNESTTNMSVLFLPVFGVSCISATVSLLCNTRYKVVAGCREPPGPSKGSLMTPWGLRARWSLFSTTAMYSRWTVAPADSI